jgi:hypothetical protein
LDSPDDFDGDFTSTFDIPSFDDFTESPLAKEADDLVYLVSIAS